MKKILASLLVLALCAPAMAATISLSDLGGGQAKITVDATADGVNIVGLGLDVDVTGGSVSAVSVDTANFNIFPDAAYSQELGGDYVYGTGSPVAAKTVPGQIDLPQSSFALSLGNLNGEATAGADGALVVEITVDWSGDQLDVCENATRGGIVAVDGSALDADCASLIGGPECVSSSASFYNDWVTFGSPACWCYAQNCLGDVDGAQEGNILQGYAWVYNADLNVLLAAYGVREPGKGPGIGTITDGICADFARDQEGNILQGYARVYNNDLNILLTNYGIREPGKGPGIGDCTGPDYNFFVTP